MSSPHADLSKGKYFTRHSPSAENRKQRRGLHLYAGPETDSQLSITPTETPLNNAVLTGAFSLSGHKWPPGHKFQIN